MNHDPSKRPTPDPTRLGRLHLICLLSAALVSMGLLVLPFAHPNGGWGFYIDLYPFTTAIFWAFACLISGMAVGFLFGIPRVDQGRHHTPVTATSTTPQPGSGQPATATVGAPGAGQSVTATAQAQGGAPPVRAGQANASVSEGGEVGDYSQRVNTNLEEISDWLTKIIVGLGLVELRKVPDHLNSMATVLAHCLGQECSVALASALIVWYAVLGFFVGYLPTRIYLAFVFAIADRMSKKALEYLTATNAMDIVRRQSEDLMQRNVAELDAIATGLSALQPNVDPKLVEPAIAKLTAVLADDMARPRSAIILGRLYRWKKNDLGKGIEVLTTTIDAMRVANQLTPAYAALLYNRACYRVLMGIPTDATARGVFVKAVLDDLTTALAVDRTLADLARGDSDLVTFRDDPGFKALLEKYPPPPPPSNSPLPQ